MCDDNYYGRHRAGMYECWRTPPNNNNYEGPPCRYLLKKNPLIIIGCNPSAANEEHSDPTMVLVDGFCQRNGYGGYIMLNLYPQIAGNVGGLPNNINNEIHSFNVHIIERTIKENNKSDILFAFGQIIEEKDYLYNICYNDVRNLLTRLINDGVINNDQIRKIAGRNIRNNQIETFDYPPHFRNPGFNNNNVERVIDPDPFDFEAYHIQNH